MKEAVEEMKDILAYKCEAFDITVDIQLRGFDKILGENGVDTDNFTILMDQQRV